MCLVYFHTSLSSVTDDKLQEVPSIAILNDLIGAKIEDKYHLFGVAVGLEDNYLNSLRIDYPNCQERFNQVFNKWSQTNPDSFTWGTVINVLQSDTIKAHKVVESITDYLTKSHQTVAVCSTVPSGMIKVN